MLPIISKIAVYCFSCLIDRSEAHHIHGNYSWQFSAILDMELTLVANLSSQGNDGEIAKKLVCKGERFLT